MHNFLIITKPFIKNLVQVLRSYRIRHGPIQKQTKTKYVIPIKQARDISMILLALADAGIEVKLANDPTVL